MVALTETEIELFFFLILPRLVRILQRNKTIRIYVCIQRFSIRNWLMWLWRLTNPKSCRVSLQARDIGEPMVQFHFQSGGWQAQDPERAYVSVQFLGQEKKKNVPVLKHSGRKRGGRAFLFYSYLQLTGWGPPRLGRVIALLSLLIWTLISALTGEPRIIFWPIIWASCAPVKLGHVKIKHHTT